MLHVRRYSQSPACDGESLLISRSDTGHRLYLEATANMCRFRNWKWRGPRTHVGAHAWIADRKITDSMIVKYTCRNRMIFCIKLSFVEIQCNIYPYTE